MISIVDCFLSNFKKLLLTWALMLPVIVNGGESKQILASIKPLALIAQELTTGTDLKVNYLLSPNVSEHNYALKISDIKKLREASLVIWLDPDLEPYLSSSQEKWLAPGEHNKNLSLMMGMNPELSLVEGEVSDHRHTTPDPHIWLSPLLAQQAAKQIADRLGEIYPENQARVENNLRLFYKKSEILDKEIAGLLRPVHGKPFVVYHQAYGYFVKHYGLNQVAALHIHPGSAMSLKQLHAIQLIMDRESQAICLFHEPQFAAMPVPVFTTKSVINTGELDPLGMYAGTYDQLIQNLANNLVSCLRAK